MLSDALCEGLWGIDHYLADTDWYEGATRDRAWAIRAAMGSLSMYLDVGPSTADAMEAAIAGNTAALDAKIVELTEEWRQQTPPNVNLEFSPSAFRARALAAVRVLQLIDTHIVPLLPELQALAPESQKD